MCAYYNKAKAKFFSFYSYNIQHLYSKGLSSVLTRHDHVVIWFKLELMCQVCLTIINLVSMTTWQGFEKLMPFLNYLKTEQTNSSFGYSQMYHVT